MSDDTRAQDPQFEAVRGVAEFFRETTDAANDLARDIKAALEDPEAAVNTLLSKSDDADVIEWRTWDEKVAEQIRQAEAKRAEKREQIMAYARENLAEDEFDVESARGEFLDTRKRARAMEKALAAIVGQDRMKALLDYFGIAAILNLRAGSGSDGAESGADRIIRPRIAAATFDGENAPKATFGDLTTWARKKTGVKIEKNALRDAAFEAAGTQDLSSLDPGTVVSFSVVLDGKSYPVTVTTVGRKSDDENEAEDESGEDGNEEA